MKQRRNKFIAMVLSLLMALSLLPTVALATEPDIILAQPSAENSYQFDLKTGSFVSASFQWYPCAVQETLLTASNTDVVYDAYGDPQSGTHKGT